MEIEQLDFSKICRICLMEGTMMSLFKVNMSKKIMACATIQVWPNDGLPGQICTKCASKLHISFQFKKQCEKSDLKLRQYLLIRPSREDKKGAENLQTNIEIVEENIPQQEEVQTTTHNIYTQDNTTVLENISYGHFMTVQPNTQPVTQVTYENLTNGNQIQVDNYNMQTHMVYNAQYSVPNQPVQENTPISHSQVIQLEMTSQNPLAQVCNEKSNGNDESETVKKEGSDGKACTVCGKVFRTNIKLNRHMKIHSFPKDLPHKCGVCGKGFSHSGNFKIHLRIHSNERPFKCPVCNRGCRQAQDLEKHMRTHTGERPHKCHFCPKAFATSSNLTAHIRTHTGERPYVCCVCQKAFCQSNELTKHMRTHTGEKSHICDICNKGFNSSSGLLAHRRQHTGERPYVCQQCHRGFTFSNCLAAHLKTHKKPNPLKCELCELTFSTLLSLKNHVAAQHKIAEPLQCKLCQKNFVKVTDYVLHMRTHVEGEES